MATTNSFIVAVIQSLIFGTGIARVISLGTFYVFVRAVYDLFFHPLRKWPGPKLWAVSQIPFSMAWMSGSGHKKMLALHQKYGDIVRVAPNQLIFGYPEAWNDVMGHRRPGQSVNGKDPDFWRDNDRLTLVGSNGERHDRLRKILSPGFSTQAMVQQQPIFQHYTSLLMDRLRTASQDGKSLDMVSWFNWATFDLGGDLIFGEPFGCLQDTKYHPWIRVLFTHIMGIAFSTTVIRFRFHEVLVKLITPRSVVKDAKAHHEFVEAQVCKRLRRSNPRPDFMEPMIRAYEKDQVSHDELVANAHNLILGGSETIGTTLAGTTYLLAMNRPVLIKLYGELRNHFKSEDEIDLLSVQKLNYMFAVLHEALRIYPAIPSAIPRKTPPEGSMIGGAFVPGNTILGIWQWPMFHNPKYFRDPESFVSERWLDDANFDSDRKEAMQPFSVGPRNCIGKNLAYAEMRLILAHLIWNFDMELDPRSENWLELNQMYFMWQKPELYIRLMARK